MSRSDALPTGDALPTPEGAPPAEPLNVREYEALAQAALSRAAFDFLSGGAGDEVTLRDNPAAFERWRLRPRCLVDVSHVDTTATVIGQRLALPIALAPIGLVAAFEPDAERATARAAQAAGTALVVSTFTSLTAEQIRAAAPDAILWQQVYVQADRGATRALVHSAKAAGYSAIMLTVDTPYLGRRERDLRNTHRVPAAFDPTFSWDDVAWLKAESGGLPLLLKGILTAEDARLAAEHGAVDGLVVSNHGGRQLDRAVASLDALPEIAAAVDGRLALLLDGGVRRGVDVLTALALGATAVLIGRPYAWGLAARGQAGVEHVLALLRAEVELALRLSGRRTLAEVDRSLLVRHPSALGSQEPNAAC